MKSKAKLLRKNLTEAEIKLWRLLRNKKFHGFKFRRQYWIGNYITDFACLERKLIIELDGSQHFSQTKYDQHRSQFLTQRGFQVIRFWNNEVLLNSEKVLEKIYECLVSSTPRQK